MNVQRLIQDAAEMGAARLAVNLGLSTGEMSQRKARKVYGKYFDGLVASGRIWPARQEEGRAGTKYYRVSDILSCKIEDSIPAELLP